LVPISEEIYALKEIWDLDFDKRPLAHFYHKKPFLIFEDLPITPLLNAIRFESQKARLRHGGLDERVRKTILHPSTPQIEERFAAILEPLRPEIERFFRIRLLGGTKLQILDYPEGGHYLRHADNASELVRDGRVVGYKEVAPQRKLTTLLFLGGEFAGGELEFCHLRTKDGKRVIIEPRAGMMVVFPSHGLFAHRVHPVRSGCRLAAVKWWDGVC